MRSRVVAQEESRCRSVTPLVSDVLLQVGEGLHVAFAIDGRPFTQKHDPQRSIAVEEEREHYFSTVLVAFGFEGGDLFRFVP